MNLAAFNRMARRLVAHHLSYTEGMEFYIVDDENDFVKFYFCDNGDGTYTVYLVKKDLFVSRKKYPEFQQELLIERLKDALSYLYYNRPESINEIGKEFRDYFSSVDTVDQKELIKLLRNANISRKAINEVFSEDGDDYTDSDLVFKYKSWGVRLFNKDLGHSDAISFLDKVEKRLGSRLKYLCYGNVNFLEEDASGDIGAFYNHDRDDITIINYNKVIYSFIHEIGHRLYRLFLNDAQRDSIRKKYANYVSNLSDIKLKLGDVIKTSDGLTIKIVSDDVSFDDGLYYMKGRILADVYDKTHFNIGEIKHCYLPREMIKYVNKKRIPIEFPNDYSMTQHEEFFSDMFSTWRFNRLNGDDKAWIEGLLFGND